jgi:hypothetical protein
MKIKIYMTKPGIKGNQENNYREGGKAGIFFGDQKCGRFFCPA